MPVGPQEVVMGDNMFVEISWRRESSMKIKCEIEDNFIFPWIGGIASSKDFLWFNTGETTFDQGMSDDLFSITREGKKLIFHSDWTHEFTSEGVLIDILGSGNEYLVNFGFIND